MTYKCLKAVAFCFCWGFHKASSSQKMQTVLFLVAEIGVIVRGDPSGKRGNWERELNCVLGLREQQLQNAVFCKESFCFHLSDPCPRILRMA